MFASESIISDTRQFLVIGHVQNLSSESFCKSCAGGLDDAICILYS